MYNQRLWVFFPLNVSVRTLYGDVAAYSPDTLHQHPPFTSVTIDTSTSDSRTAYADHKYSMYAIIWLAAWILASLSSESVEHAKSMLLFLATGISQHLLIQEPGADWGMT